MENIFSDKLTDYNSGSRSGNQLSFTELYRMINDTFSLFEPGLKKYDIKYNITKIDSDLEFKVTSKFDSILLSLITRLLSEKFSGQHIKIKFKILWNNSSFQPEKLRIRFMTQQLDKKSGNKKCNCNNIFKLMDLKDVKIKTVKKRNLFECLIAEFPIIPIFTPAFISMINFEKSGNQNLKDTDNSIFLTNLKTHLSNYLSLENIDFDNLCSKFAMSRSTLYRKIKMETGLSPSRFIRSHYLELAAKRLSATNDPITDIAYDFGFNNSSYFSKSFREKFNESPMSYRKKSRRIL